jgi:hypothetical protein
MSAADASSRSSAGWVILAAALAVPGFLFYNWSSRLKADHDRSVTAKARNRVPQGNVFETPPAASRLVTPAAGAGSAIPGKTGAVAMPVANPASTKPALPPPSLPSAAMPPIAASPASLPGAAGAPGAKPGGAASALAGSNAPGMTISSATVVLPRDPLISPLDTVRIHKYEQDLWNAQHPIEKPKAHGVRSKPVERPVSEDVDLQGIVTSPDGRPLAIVNDETLSAGASFSAPGHAGTVKILSITSDTVWFVYKNKRFKKVVTTE